MITCNAVFVVKCEELKLRMVISEELRHGRLKRIDFYFFG